MDLARYYDESDLLDSLYEFHPDEFLELDSSDMDDLRAYYALGLRVDNLAEWAGEHIVDDVELQARAEKVFERVCQRFQIDFQ